MSQSHYIFTSPERPVHLYLLALSSSPPPSTVSDYDTQYRYHVTSVHSTLQGAQAVFNEMVAAAKFCKDSSDPGGLWTAAKWGMNGELISVLMIKRRTLEG